MKAIIIEPIVRIHLLNIHVGKHVCMHTKIHAHRDTPGDEFFLVTTVFLTSSALCSHTTIHPINVRMIHVRPFTYVNSSQSTKFERMGEGCRFMGVYGCTAKADLCGVAMLRCHLLRRALMLHLPHRLLTTQNTEKGHREIVLLSDGNRRVHSFQYAEFAR